ncbi:hypothetical protein GCM10023093_09040 [Nemorincola caseinilytica]|uniref:DUF4293 family protein n=1 Tax=Nemorincola caseinilytica TaxID=2054315 RepID=A0ABP8N713_9BACT
MIQRKQSIWLLVAALLNSGVFFFDLYRADGIPPVRVADNFPSLLIALIMTALPLITIFMFRNRKRQARMTMVCVLDNSIFTSFMLSRITRLDNAVPPPVNGNYWIGAVLPVAAIIFLVLAAIGIRGDEKLVRSTDRLR